MTAAMLVAATVALGFGPETVTMNAEAGGAGRNGFESGSYGSVDAPGTLFHLDVLDLHTRNGPDIFIEIDTVVPQDFWESVIIDGTGWSSGELLSANANSFTNPGSATSRWRFDVVVSGFTALDAYTFVFIPGSA